MGAPKEASSYWRVTILSTSLKYVGAEAQQSAATSISRFEYVFPSNRTPSNIIGASDDPVEYTIALSSLF